MRISEKIWTDVQHALQDAGKWKSHYDSKELRETPNEALVPLLQKLEQIDSQKTIWIAIAAIVAVAALVLMSLALAGVTPFASGLIFAAFPAGIALLATIMAVWTHCQYRGQIDQIVDKANKGLPFA